MDNGKRGGTIFDIRRFSTHDGGGIRTTVFLKGCPLSCAWCHNPEGMSTRRRPLHFLKRCIGCGICVGYCRCGGMEMTADGIKIHAGKKEDWDRLVKNCPANAIVWDSRRMTAREAVDEIMRDEAFFRHGGGVTLSGGEPLLQPDFAAAILKELRAKGVHTAAETSLYAERETLLKVLAHVDFIYADFKLIDSARHERYTGVPNERIKENIRILLESAKRDHVVIRTPMIPQITADAENIAGICRYITAVYPDAAYELLNYNPLAAAKYPLVDRAYPIQGRLTKFTQAAMEGFAAIACQNGVKPRRLIMEP